MNTKICTKCKEERIIDDFYKRKDDSYRGVCKKCQRKRQKQYYITNIDRERERKRKGFSGDIKVYNTYESLYSTYAHQLTIDENPKLADDGESLEVRCRYCGKYFKPTNISVKSRRNALKGMVKGECSLYCSDGCKNSCSTYNRKLYPRGHKPATSREVQPQLRKMVLKRDNWACMKCGNIEELHCHHIDPVKLNPIESADVDNCITLCIDCHKVAHQKDGCEYGKLANCD